MQHLLGPAPANRRRQLVHGSGCTAVGGCAVEIAGGIEDHARIRIMSLAVRKAMQDSLRPRAGCAAASVSWGRQAEDCATPQTGASASAAVIGCAIQQAARTEDQVGGRIHSVVPSGEGIQRAEGPTRADAL